MSNVYVLRHETNHEAYNIAHSVEDVREALKDFYQLSMTVVPDEEFEDDFLEIKQSEFDSIDTMTMDELTDRINRFGWQVLILNENELKEFQNKG